MITADRPDPIQTFGVYCEVCERASEEATVLDDCQDCRVPLLEVQLYKCPLCGKTYLEVYRAQSCISTCLRRQGSRLERMWG